MREDPRFNFTISDWAQTKDVDHLGIQVEDKEELADVYGRLQEAQAPQWEEGEMTCCYAKSEKTWATNPNEVSREPLLGSGDSSVYGDEISPVIVNGQCCMRESSVQEAQGFC